MKYATTGRPGGWALTTTFDAPTAAFAPGAAAFIEFDGVQGLGTVLLNGRCSPLPPETAVG